MLAMQKTIPSWVRVGGSPTRRIQVGYVTWLEYYSIPVTYRYYMSNIVYTSTQLGVSFILVPIQEGKKAQMPY